MNFLLQLVYGNVLYFASFSYLSHSHAEFLNIKYSNMDFLMSYWSFKFKMVLESVKMGTKKHTPQLYNSTYLLPRTENVGYCVLCGQVL